MFSFILRVLVEIFISVRDDDNNDIKKGNYRRRKKLNRYCDDCTKTPDQVYRYKNAYLCEVCYNDAVIRFGELPSGSRGKGK